MNAEERAEVTRDVAHIVAEALSPSLNTINRGFEIMISSAERQEKLFEHVISFEERQEKLLERIVSVEERQETVLEQMAQALGLIIERLRRN